MFHFYFVELFYFTYSIKFHADYICVKIYYTFFEFQIIKLLLNAYQQYMSFLFSGH